MSRFTCFQVVCLLTFSLLTGFGAQAGDTPARPASSSSAAATIDASRPAYIMAWRMAHQTTEYTDALRLTSLLATRIGLAAGPAREALGRFLNTTLAGNPGRFDPADEPLAVLTQLLREDVGGFQRVLAPLAPEDAYQRYLQLLDTLDIR